MKRNSSAEKLFGSLNKHAEPLEKAIGRHRISRGDESHHTPVKEFSLSVTARAGTAPCLHSVRNAYRRAFVLLSIMSGQETSTDGAVLDPLRCWEKSDVSGTLLVPFVLPGVAQQRALSLPTSQESVD